MSDRRINTIKYAISIVFLLIVGTTYGSFHPTLKAVGLALSLILIGIWTLSRALTDRRLSIPRAFLPLLALLIFQALRGPFTLHPQPALERVLMSCTIVLILLFIFDAIEKGWGHPIWENAMLNLAVIFSLIELALAVFWYQRWWEMSGISGSVPPLGYRSTGLFLGHANVLAGFINLLFPIVIIRLIQARNNSGRILSIVALLLFGITEYLASSRGGWIAGSLGIGATLVLASSSILSRISRVSKSTTRKWKLQLIIPFVLFILVVGIGIGYVFIRQAQTTTGHAPIASSRTGIWGPALNIFLDAPLIGHGPGSFSTLFAAETQLPPGFATSHAHNALLQIGAEAGLVGLFLVFWASILLVRGLIRTWRSSDTEARLHLAAFVGIGTAVVTHNLVDYLFESPLYAVSVVLLATFALRKFKSGEHLRIQRRPFSIAVFSLMILIVGGTLLTSRGQSTYWKGITAGRERDWATASTDLCQAAKENPQMSLAYFQCGLALAQLHYLQADANALMTAITTYRAGLEVDTSWPVHIANLAALEFEAGNSDDAMRWMETAFNAAPRNSLFALNLGRMAEEIGDLDSAEKYYSLTLELNSWMGLSLFYQSTPLRRMILETYLENSEQTVNWTMTRQGWQALEERNNDVAFEAFNLAIEINPLDARAYAGRALLNLYLGKLDQARLDSQTALFIEPNSHWTQYVGGLIALEQDDLEEAKIHFERLYELLENQSDSWSFYARTYLRFFLTPDLVPQMPRADFTAEMAAELNNLADGLKNQGQAHLANRILKYLDQGY